VSHPDRELAAGVQPIEELLDEHRHIRKELAALWAKYGPFGVAEPLRKQELSRIKVIIRTMLDVEGKKGTVDAIDDAAHAHPDYVKFLAIMLTERARYFELEAQLKEIEWKVNRGQAVMRYSTVEAMGGGV
jgi:hypothetical protein